LSELQQYEDDFYTPVVLATPPKFDSPFELFRRQVLMEPGNYDMVLRFAFSEYSECVVFLFDAIQDIKNNIGDLSTIMIISAYDMYVTANFRVTTNMELSVYEDLTESVERMRLNKHSYQEIHMVTRVLEILSVRTLMEMYQRMLDTKYYSPRGKGFEAASKKGLCRELTKCVFPNASSQCRRRNVLSMRNTLKRLSTRLSIRL
jgi:hypothetical protein